MFTFATDLHAPAIHLTKTVENVTSPGGPAGPGDTLRYTVSVENTGQDGATGFEVSDVIPAGVAYVPGSLELLTGPGAPASPTDAAGDDVAELDAANNRVAFRLGTGANATEGGLIGAAGSSGDNASFSFDVTVDANNPDGAEIVNRAHASFFGQTLGVPLTAESAAVTTTVAAPDLTITKTHTGPLTGGVSTPFTLVVSNEGADATDGSTVTVSDTFPAAAFASVAVTSAPGWSCGVVATAVTCTRSDVLAAANAYPPIQLSALVVPVPPAQIENTATVAGGGDSVLTNNSSTDVGPGVVEADLQLTKSVQPGTALTGEQVTFALVVRNGGPSAATGVVLDDPFGPNFTAQSAVSTQGTCDSTVSCALGTLAPDAEATVTIVATVDGTGPSHDNTATVTSGSPDPTPGNDSATTTVTVPNTADLSSRRPEAPRRPTPASPTGSRTRSPSRNRSGARDGRARHRPAAGAVHALERRRGRVHLQPASRGRDAGLHQADPERRRWTGRDQRRRTMALAASAEVVKNSASIEAAQGDPRPDDNTATASNLVIPAADLDLFKTADRDTLRPGGDGHLHAHGQEPGPSGAQNVVLTDTLGGAARTVVRPRRARGAAPRPSRWNARSARWPTAPRQPWSSLSGRTRPGS